MTEEQIVLNYIEESLRNEEEITLTLDEAKIVSDALAYFIDEKDK